MIKHWLTATLKHMMLFISKRLRCVAVCFPQQICAALQSAKCAERASSSGEACEDHQIIVMCLPQDRQTCRLAALRALLPIIVDDSRPCASACVIQTCMYICTCASDVCIHCYPLIDVRSLA